MYGGNPHDLVVALRMIPHYPRPECSPPESGRRCVRSTCSFSATLLPFVVGKNQPGSYPFCRKTTGQGRKWVSFPNRGER
jgi:hypothetical protein